MSPKHAAGLAGLPLAPHPALQRPLPKGPVFGWDNFAPAAPGPLPSGVLELPQQAFTTSGRAAIFHALLQLPIRPGRQVLLPSYHCPTMVAPVLLAGARPAYYGLTAEGLPDLDRISAEALREVDAMLVPHYFGLPKSLSRVRAWCDLHGIALIEDCAHCLFGQAGERPVGAWGDFATASLSKFLPVPEAGLLGSAQRPLPGLSLHNQGLKAQIKGLADVLDIASRHRRLLGLNSLLGSVFRAKQGLRPAEPRVRSQAESHAGPQARSDPAPAPSEAAEFMDGSDMDRIRLAPLHISRLLTALLPHRRIVQRRRENYLHYTRELASLAGSRALQTELDPSAAPYVFPLWIEQAENADRVYHQLRLQGFPVFRWDRIWPGTPTLEGDAGPLWSRHVLQLLCHQDLYDEDVERTIHATRLALR